METSKAIRTRRSIREFQDKEIPQYIIDKIIDAAKHAPSSNDSQPWEFIIIKDKKIKSELSELHPWAKFIEKSPVIIAVLGDLEKCKDEFLNTINVSLATQNLLLEAHNLDLGACYIEIINKEFEIEEKTRSILNVPEHILVYCLIALGYPKSIPYQKKPKECSVYFDKYL